MRMRVLLLRSAENPDPYERALQAEGFDVQSTPVLAFEFKDLKGLRALLERPDEYSGMIFTSPRAVDALAEVMPWLPSENALWHARAAYAVGPGTAASLRRIGFESEGEHCGSAAELAAFIARRQFDEPLLFLCGDRSRDVLPEHLRQAGIDVEEHCVYVTVFRDHIEWPQERQPDWVVFFSPSGFDALRSSVENALDGVRIAAIGSTTAAAVRQAGMDVAAVAEEPSPAGVAMAIRSALS